MFTRNNPSYDIQGHSRLKNKVNCLEKVFKRLQKNKSRDMNNGKQLLELQFQQLQASTDVM